MDLPIGSARPAWVVNVVSYPSNSLMSLTLLQNMIDRPAMYFGRHDGYLREIAAFDLGMSLESGWDESRMRHRHHLILPEFCSFLCAKLPEGESGPSWMARIEDSSDSEAEAWRLFCVMWEDFKTADRHEALPA